jgi:hypothetical protein
LPNNVPTGTKFLPYPPPYRVKPVGYSGFGYPLPSLAAAADGALECVLHPPYLGRTRPVMGRRFFFFFFFDLTSDLCKIYLTDEYLENFYTLTSVARSSIFRDFWRFFYFFEFKFKILNGGGIEPAGTGTGPVRFHRFPRYPDRFRPVPLTLVTCI